MNNDVTKIFSRVSRASQTIHIKLLGDSITHGVGGTGFAQNGEPIVDSYARNPYGYCWANKFKEYMESRFNCIVVNNACTGAKIEFILEHFNDLVDDEDDIILCAIGTNNRHQFLDEFPRHTRRAHMEQFYQNIILLNNKFVAARKEVIFVANIPASAKNENGREDLLRLFHMNDVHELYVKASIACGFPLISLYTLFAQWCDSRNVSIDSLLDDGLHPNDAGHDVIFTLLINELGLGEKSSD